jgi:hypothetical protein
MLTGLRGDLSSCPRNCDVQRAYDRAMSAGPHENVNQEVLAGDRWQAIFGSAVPTLVS